MSYRMEGYHQVVPGATALLLEAWRPLLSTFFRGDSEASICMTPPMTCTRQRKVELSYLYTCCIVVARKEQQPPERLTLQHQERCEWVRCEHPGASPRQRVLSVNLTSRDWLGGITAVDLCNQMSVEKSSINVSYVAR